MSYHLLVDTCVYLSALLPKDAYHKTSQKTLECLQTKNYNILVPISIVLEILTTLKRNKIKTNDFLILHAFFGQDCFQIINIDTVFLNEIYLPNYQFFKLKIADTMIASTARHFQAHLITWDKQMICQSKNHLSVITPSQFLDLIKLSNDSSVHR